MRYITKTLMIILAVLFVALLGFVSGCNDSNSELQRLRMPASEFAAKWIEQYGDSPESVRNYNIALTQQILNRQAQAIEELRKQVNGLAATQKTFGKRVDNVKNSIDNETRTRMFKSPESSESITIDMANKYWREKNIKANDPNN